MKRAQAQLTLRYEINPNNMIDIMLEKEEFKDIKKLANSIMRAYETKVKKMQEETE